MFEQENGWENAYLWSIYNLFINLCQFQWQVKFIDTFDHLVFGESLKLGSVWDHTVNMKFNVFYSTFTNVLYSCHVFTFLTFFILISTFFYIYGPRQATLNLSGRNDCVQTFGQDVCQFLSPFGICKKIIEYSSSKIKLELYWAGVGLKLLDYPEQP